MGKNLENNKFINNFMEELNKFLKEKNDKHVNIEEQNLTKDGDIYVLYEMKNSSDKATLLNATTGEQIAVEKNKLNEIAISNLELGDNFIFKDGQFTPYNKEVKIGDKAWRMLESLYFNLRYEDGRNYEVIDIKEDEIKIRDTKINIDYTEKREDYPDWKIGDKLVRKNGTYEKK